jgi:copper homeostasis protein (lipoprotein)
MAMRGMYFYMADAAIFTDCVTGKKISVTNNAQLERDYAAAVGGRGGTAGAGIVRGAL